jgi:lipopolysaccharide transport system permease protein
MKFFKKNISAFIEEIRILIRNRDLILVMAKREISDRYVGQVFGLAWSVGHPLVLIGIYIYVFAYVFKVKVGGENDLPLDYTTYILCGLVPWLAMQECIIKACSVMISNAGLVKQVVFPLEVLPAKTVLATMFSQSISFMALLIYVLFSANFLWATYLLFPVVLMCQILLMLGLSFLLSALGAYFRDLKDITQILATVSVYLLPIFYLPSMVPEMFKPLVSFNPFSHMIWVYQDMIYYGRLEHPISWIVFPSTSILIFVYGYRVFRRLKITLPGVI